MSEIAKAISELIDSGVSLIPVGEKRHGTDRDKVPFVKSWRNSRDLSLVDVYDGMAAHDTNSVAMVMGARSGGMVCIDVDVKHKPGFDGVIFRDLKEMYPGLLSRMQVEKTPSGGYHFLFRVGGGIKIGCRNVARRMASKEELALGKDKTRCFLEIKSEGGLAQCYPSTGYELVRKRDGDWGVLSEEEYIGLSIFLDGYDEIVKVEYVKPEKKQSQWYSTNPFEDFDGGIEADSVLRGENWIVAKENDSFCYYNRPGQKDKQYAASYFKSKNQYTIFSTQAGVDNKTYSPSNLACQLRFGGDKSLMYSWLVENGYGRIKPEIEKKIIERVAVSGGLLPKNISTSRGEKGWRGFGKR